MVYRVTEWQQLYMPATAYAMSEIDRPLSAKYDIDLKRLREELESVDASTHLLNSIPIPNTRGLKPVVIVKQCPDIMVYVLKQSLTVKIHYMMV